MKDRFWAVVTAIMFVGLCALAGCTPSQQAGVTKVTDAITAACTEANGLLGLVGLVPGAGQIATYIQAGCNTEAGLAKLAADPTSAAWVGTLIGQIRTLAKQAGVKV